MNDALALIAAERERQQLVEGWTPSHDDTHRDGEMARAAACYALPSRYRDWHSVLHRLWPWAPEWWKPTPDDRMRELVKAGALIVAEIERLQRAALRDGTTCEHNWVDARNEVVLGGEFCTKCGALRDGTTREEG